MEWSMSNAPKPSQDTSSHAVILEALLFAGGPPIDEIRLVELIGESEEGPVVEAVAHLNQLYFRQGRPYEIRRVRNGFQMALRHEFAPIVRRLRGRSREVRLSVAAIEVLSIVAYRQPVPVQAIDSIRGVESSAIIRQLRRRNLIELEDSPEADSSSPRFRTTKRFLELFHLNSLDDLPRVHELDRA
jgi:segregation and condensation protein B